jgi:hypothetical protein
MHDKYEALYERKQNGKPKAYLNVFFAIFYFVVLKR